MDPKPILEICMGTGCHQLGVMEVLERLMALLEGAGVKDQVELKGMFCGENCCRAIYLRMGDVTFGNVRPHNIDRVFGEEILPCIESQCTVNAGGLRR